VLIASWNLAGRVTRLPEQAELLIGLAADVLCLQELTLSTLSIWVELLHDAGYHTVAAGDPGGERNRPLRVLTAARGPLREVPVPGVPWRERVLAVRTRDGSEIVNVHSPTSPKPDLAKLRTHEAAFAHLAHCAPDRLRVLCGDLNTPRKEHPTGRSGPSPATATGDCDRSAARRGSAPS
jgi:exonuclease III